MVNKFFKYTSALLIGAMSLTSCVDEIMNSATANSEDEVIERTLYLDLIAGDAVQNNSRSINTQEGAPVLLNCLWVGAYDVETGKSVGNYSARLEDDPIASGVVQEGYIRMNTVAKNSGGKKIYVVGMANYDGVYTRNGVELSDSYLNSLTWDDIIDIQIDTESAYAGDKGSDSKAEAPFLFGFFQDAMTLFHSPKVDQFRFDENVSQKKARTAMYPLDAESGMTINIESTPANADKDMYVKAGALCLRRLVSTVKVEFDEEVMEVRNIRYRRFNMPKVVYLAQRRTDTNVYDNFASWQKNSPNAADLYMTENDYENKNAGDPYYNDADWITPTGQYVEFQHFENKHYGFGDLASHAARETIVNGYFDALTHYGQYYNDYASYFMINADVTNKKTGQRANVTYTIHEGLCNTPDGQRVEDYGYPGDEYYDFATYRNTNYTYKITINGFNDIKVHVETDAPHIAGQYGDVTSMVYVTGSRDETIPYQGSTYSNILEFDKNADLGFRLYGFDAATNQPIDIWYNVPTEYNTYFRSSWPEKASTAKEINSLDDLIQTVIDSKLLNAFKINGSINIVDFMAQADNSTTKKYSLTATAYTDFDGVKAMKRTYLRALYIFDKNDLKRDEEGCCTVKRIFAAEQSPNVIVPDVFRLTLNDMIWTYDVYTYPVTTLTHDNIWISCANSTIQLKWRHSEGVKGYTIEVYNLTGSLMKTVTISNAYQYVTKDSYYGDVFTYNMPTTGLYADGTAFGSGANNYSVKITPIVDPVYYGMAEPLMIQSSSAGPGIRICPAAWSFVETKEWKEVTTGGLRFVTTEPYTYLRGLYYIGGTAPTAYSNGIGLPQGTSSNNCLIFYAASPGTINIKGSFSTAALLYTIVYVGQKTSKDATSMSTIRTLSTLNTTTGTTISIPQGWIVIYGTSLFSWSGTGYSEPLIQSILYTPSY